MSDKPRRIIVAISGASGAILGIQVLELLREARVETHLILSAAARKTLKLEASVDAEQVEALASERYDPENIGSRIASGSFVTDGMMVVPCSIKTLSGIANSYANDLIVRSADVCLKEGRILLLAVRETPMHMGHLRLMLQAAEMGAILFPPTPSFYGRPQSVDELVTNLAARMLLRMGVENEVYTRWAGEGNEWR